MTEKETSKKMTSEELQSLLDQDKQDRLQKCKSEIDAILQKYGCQLVAVPQITPDGRIGAMATIKFLSN